MVTGHLLDIITVLAALILIWPLLAWSDDRRGLGHGVGAYDCF